MNNKYVIVHPDGSEREIIIGTGDMLVYDVCKIKDYEGGDYVPRKARQMDNVFLPVPEGEVTDG